MDPVNALIASIKNNEISFINFNEVPCFSSVDQFNEFVLAFNENSSITNHEGEVPVVDDFEVVLYDQDYSLSFEQKCSSIYSVISHNNDFYKKYQERPVADTLDLSVLNSFDGTDAKRLYACLVNDIEVRNIILPATGIQNVGIEGLRKIDQLVGENHGIRTISNLVGGNLNFINLITKKLDYNKEGFNTFSESLEGIKNNFYVIIDFNSILDFKSYEQLVQLAEAIQDDFYVTQLIGDIKKILYSEYQKDETKVHFLNEGLIENTVNKLYKKVNNNYGFVKALLPENIINGVLDLSKIAIGDKELHFLSDYVEVESKIDKIDFSKSIYDCSEVEKDHFKRKVWINSTEIYVEGVFDSSFGLKKTHLISIGSFLYNFKEDSVNCLDFNFIPNYDSMSAEDSMSCLTSILEIIDLNLKITFYRGDPYCIMNNPQISNRSDIDKINFRMIINRILVTIQANNKVKADVFSGIERMRDNELTIRVSKPLTDVSSNVDYLPRLALYIINDKSDIFISVNLNYLSVSTRNHLDPAIIGRFIEAAEKNPRLVSVEYGLDLSENNTSLPLKMALEKLDQKIIENNTQIVINESDRKLRDKLKETPNESTLIDLREIQLFAKNIDFLKKELEKFPDVDTLEVCLANKEAVNCFFNLINSSSKIENIHFKEVCKGNYNAGAYYFNLKKRELWSEIDSLFNLTKVASNPFIEIFKNLKGNSKIKKITIEGPGTLKFTSTCNGAIQQMPGLTHFEFISAIKVNKKKCIQNLFENRHLKYVSLNKCKFEDVANALKDNHTLKKLEVHEFIYPKDDMVFKELKDKVARNFTLIELKVHNPETSGKSIAFFNKIQEIIERNKMFNETIFKDQLRLDQVHEFRDYFVTYVNGIYPHYTDIFNNFSEGNLEEDINNFLKKALDSNFMLKHICENYLYNSEVATFIALHEKLKSSEPRLTWLQILGIESNNAEEDQQVLEDIRTPKSLDRLVNDFFEGVYNEACEQREKYEEARGEDINLSPWIKPQPEKRLSSGNNTTESGSKRQKTKDQREVGVSIASGSSSM